MEGSNVPTGSGEANGTTQAQAYCRSLNLDLRNPLVRALRTDVTGCAQAGADDPLNIDDGTFTVTDQVSGAAS